MKFVDLEILKIKWSVFDWSSQLRRLVRTFNVNGKGVGFSVETGAEVSKLTMTTVK